MTDTPLTPSEVQTQIHARLPYVAGLLEADTLIDGLQLDSLDTMELLMIVDERYGVRFSLEEIQQIRTVGDFAAMIAIRYNSRSVASS